VNLHLIDLIIQISSISFRNGYLEMPLGEYFSGDYYSVTAWIKVRSFKTNSRLLEVGNGSWL